MALQLDRGDVPDDLTGVKWSDGTVECRARVTHRDGSLVANGSDVGIVLTDRDVSCDRCSDACGA